MNFKTHKYTINLLLKEVSSLNNASFNSPSALASVLSPVAKSKSAKFSALRSYVASSGSLNAILSGTSTKVSGRTPKARLLNALRARKSA